MTEHIVPRQTYVGVFVALLLLTGATVGASFLPLGHPGHVLVGLGIAAAKAALVVLYFMHVRYGPRLTWLFLGAAMLFLAIMVVLTVTDYASRDWWPVLGK